MKRLLLIIIIALIPASAPASVHLGGFVPTSKVRLQIESYENYIISSGGTSYADTHIIDATRRVTTHTTATIGTQWEVYVTYEDIEGITSQHPVVNLDTSNHSIATIIEDGIVNYVSNGDFIVTATTEETPTAPSRVVNAYLTNSSSGGETSDVTTWTIDSPSADNVLVIYNSSSEDSAAVKDYYLATRPLMSSANVLAVSCTTNEQISAADYITNIRTPLLNWIANNPTKPLRYIVLMYGLPSRTIGSGSYSVQYRISKALQEAGTRTGADYSASQEPFCAGKYQGETALVTSINMGSVADCTAYIDKLAMMYAAMAAPSILISADDAEYNLTPVYAFDDTGRIYSFSKPGLDSSNSVLAVNPSADILYSGSSGDSPAPDQTTHITTCADVLGYHTWGANGGQGGNYATDGSVKFTGASTWYIIRTVESFNGQLSTSQGHFTQWFSATAFGSLDNGGNYACTPVGAISHVEEPYLPGVGLPSYFGKWENGWCFADCAWQCRTTPYFQAVGDPLVKR